MVRTASLGWTCTAPQYTTILATNDYDDAPDVDPMAADARIAFHNVLFGLLVAGADGSARAALVNTQPGDVFPRWSPDENRLAFLRSSSSVAAGLLPGKLYAIQADGSQPVALTSYDVVQTGAWTPDGAYVLVVKTGASGNSVVAVATDGSGFEVPVPLAKAAVADRIGSILE